MTQREHDLPGRLLADALQRHHERTRYFDEVAARRGHSSNVVIGRFDALRGQAPTEREIAVLQFVADGLTNKEIAVRLSLSEATIRSCIQRIQAKLDAENRAHAVALAYEQGWIGISVAEPTLTDEGWAQQAPGSRQFRLPSSRERLALVPRPTEEIEAVDAEEATPRVLARIG